jgi:16S rRNA (cytosine967-C5)-methyltransferase
LTPAARLKAAAEALDRIAETRAPAESVLKAWGRENRYAGSKDRRAIADRVYKCLRARARLAWAMGDDTGRALVLGSLALLDAAPLSEIETLFTGEGYAPAPLSAEERARLQAGTGEPPAWVTAGLPAFAAEDLRATYREGWAEEAKALLLPRAPIDLRVNGAKAKVETVLAELAAEGLTAERTPWSAWGLRLSAEPPPNVQKLAAYREGRLEVQDEGSQLAAWLASAKPGMIVVDYCAGGGGKTLALAQAMEGRGRLVACDVDPKRLENIRPRLKRAGVEAELRQLGSEGEGVHDLEGSADLVLVDAPCSGSGTWRRRPEEASRLTAEDVERLHALQITVLDRAARLVRPGGRLAYVTCSVLRREDEDTAAAFEAAHAGFRPIPITAALDASQITPAAPERLGGLANGHYLRLSPRAVGTDGFFIALYERTS